MISNHKKAVIIGETKLCTQCAEYLLSNNWKIISIVSNDHVVIDWAKNNAITVLPPTELSTIKTSNFYLFSIINPYLIPSSFLANKNLLLALNYHDSPLPRYAGVNSTTWAILNNEKQHGVTLHKIVSGIDEGDIAAQSLIAIEKDEGFYLKLKKKFGDVDNLELVHYDFLNFELPHYPYKVFANTPFIITADVIRKLTSDKNFPYKSIFMSSTEYPLV